jgi:hypothetical protein
MQKTWILIVILVVMETQTAMPNIVVVAIMLAFIRQVVFFIISLKGLLCKQYVFDCNSLLKNHSSTSLLWEWMSQQLLSRVLYLNLIYEVLIKNTNFSVIPNMGLLKFKILKRFWKNSKTDEKVWLSFLQKDREDSYC